MDLSKMDRKEKFAYLKAKGIPYRVTFTNKQINDLCQGKTVEVPKKRRSATKDRVPLGTHRQKLNVDNYDIPEDKVVRWINDHPGRVDSALGGGYTFVQDPKQEVKVGDDPLRHRGMDSAVTAIVGTTDGGEPIRAYLMMLDKDLYEEDKAAKEAEMDKTDASIRRGVGPGASEEGMYSADGGIKYNSNQ